MITKDLIKYDSIEKCLEQLKHIDYDSNVVKGFFLFFNSDLKTFSFIFRNPKQYELFYKLHNKEFESPLKATHNAIDFINNNPQLFSYVNT